MFRKYINFFKIKLLDLKKNDLLLLFKILRILLLSKIKRKERGIKRTVRLISNFPGLWQRTIEQTPGGNCVFGSTLFISSGIADHYLILNSLGGDTKIIKSLNINIKKINQENIWALHMEPEEYIKLLGYDFGFENSIASKFFTNSKSLLESNSKYIPSPPYVHFHIGKSWDFLKNSRPVKKKIKLGIITSDLNKLDGHKNRLKFLEALDDSDIDCSIWGRGNGLSKLKKYKGMVLNKWSVHSICEYTIVLENSVSPLYWSEKVVDVLLAYSLPLYYGSTNLNKYLPNDSFIPIDINDKNCIESIKNIIKSNLYQERLVSISKARDIILEKENLYSFIDRNLDLYKI